MNEVSISAQNLPDSMEDLSRFVLIGRERLVAVRAAIRAIDKVGVAAEVYQQKLAEGQEIAEAVLDAEVRLGELRASVPREQGKRTDKPMHHEVQKSTLSDFDEKAQLTRRIAPQIEQIASRPDIVERVKAEKREAGEIVTRQDVLNAIKAEEQASREPQAPQEPQSPQKPHVSYNSGNNEWYTPADIIEAAREVMGGIDLDPASSDIANEVVKAGTYYTAENSGLENPWFGNIWLNPPYAAELIGKFSDALVERRSDYQQAIVLVNNATETKWFASVADIASAIVFPTSRVKFYMPNKQTGAPLQGQAILYIGNSTGKFLEIFSKFGWGANVWKM